jgi:hypothetical protein
MGEKSDQIEREIREKRSELSNNFNELEQKVKNAIDWRSQFEEHPGALIALAFGGGIVLSALLPAMRLPRRSRSAAYDDYLRYSEKSYNGNQAPPPPMERSSGGLDTPPGARNGKTGEARNNFDALAGALLSLAVTGVTGVIDNVLPGFQHEFMKAKSSKTAHS